MIKRPARDIPAVLMTIDATDFIVRPRWSSRGLQAISRAVTLAVALLAVACVPEDGRDDLVHVGPLEQVPFAVSDVFTPSGQMGDGALPDFLTASSGSTCRSRPAGARGRCYKFHYQPGGVLWAGTYWAYPSNNWGSEAGRKFKPWLIRGGQLTQRYNRVTFGAAAERDTFVIKLSGGDSLGKVYTLRNAVFTVEGPTRHDITGDSYMRIDPATDMPRVNDPKALLTVKPGTYTVSLNPGWRLVAPNAMGQLEEVIGATLPVTTTSFTIAPGADAVASLDFIVGTETIRITMSNPTVPVNFFAGDINDPFLRTITCQDPNKICEHRDLVSTAKPVLQLSRSWQSLSLRLLISPPCVGAMTVDGMVETSKFADAMTGVVACASGTLRADGTVANCPPGKPGILSADQQTITCCETPLVSGVCQGVSSLGSWVRADDITLTVIGGFGWATNYAEFEAQNAILPGEDPHIAAARAPTTIYLDDIVWDFVTEMPAATP